MPIKFVFNYLYIYFCLILHKVWIYLASCVKLFEEWILKYGKATFFVDIYYNALKLHREEGVVGIIFSFFSTVFYNDSKLPKNVESIGMAIKEIKKEQMYDR
jgi:hypothetical protein